MRRVRCDASRRYCTGMESIQRDVIDEIERRRQKAGGSYLEFLRRESMSIGLYRLGAGEEDRQQPHGEDEAYYVLSGRARFTAGNEDGEVGPGSVLYVAKGVEHRFHSIEEELSVLVFFAPAEGSGAGG